jgi:hypothetical protein
MRFFFVGLLIASIPAESALITYTDRAAFAAATSGVSNITFEGLAPANGSQSYPDPTGLVTGGVTFRTFGMTPGSVTVYGADAAQQSPGLDTGTGAILTWESSGQGYFLDVLLSGGRTAFAVDLWARQPSSSTIQAFVNSGEAGQNFNISTSNRPTSSFFGITSDSTTILLVRLSVPTGQLGVILDNVSVGAAGAAPIPEPGTWMLLGAGLFGLLAVRRSHAIH